MPYALKMQRFSHFHNQFVYTLRTILGSEKKCPFPRFFVLRQFREISYTSHVIVFLRRGFGRTVTDQKGFWVIVMLTIICRKLVVLLLVSVVLGGTGSPSLWANETLDIALSLHNNREYDRAINEFKRFLTANPNHPERSKANYFLAECLIQKGRPDEAFVYLDDILGKQLSAIKIAPKDSFFNIDYYRTNIQPKMAVAHDIAYGRHALFRAGEIAYTSDDLENGRRFLYAFLVEFSNDSLNALTLPYLGDIAKQNYEIAIHQGYNAVGRVYAEEAEYYFGTTVDVYPDSSLYKESLMGLAWAKSRLGKYAEATPIFRQLALEPNSKLAENAYYEWGLMYYEQGNYSQAITTLLNFERQYPRSEFRNDSMRVRAKSLAGQEKYQDTLNLLKQITAKKVEDYLLEIRCLYGMKEYEAASKELADLDKSPISQPVKDEIRLLQAVDAMVKNDRNSAILILESLLRPKYDIATRTITFAYYDPPERGRGRGGSSGSDTSMQGKLSEEKFLKACAILCINYAIVGRKDESNATINAMVQIAKPDDDRQAHIIDNTVDYLAKIGPDAANNPNWGLAGGESIPIDPSHDGGIYFGPIIDERDLTPAGQNRGGSSGNRGNQSSLGLSSGNSGRPQSSGERYGSNRPNNSGSTGTSQTTQEFRRELQNCQTLISRKNWREADKRLLALLQSDPSPPNAIAAEAASLRVKVLLELGNESEAEVMCDLILNTYRNTVFYADALWISGEYFERHGKLNKALDRFRILADDHPNHDYADGALFHLAWDDLENGSKPAAMRKFKTIYTKHRNGEYWSHGTWGLAYLAYEDKKFEEAEEYVQELLNHPPDQAILDRVLFLKAVLAEKFENWAIAEMAYSTLAKYCPDSSLARRASNQAAVARNKANQMNNNR